MHFASLVKNGELERALLFFTTAIMNWHRCPGLRCQKSPKARVVLSKCGRSDLLQESNSRS